MKKSFALAAAVGLMITASAASAQAVNVTNVAFTPGSVTGTIHSPSLTGEVGIGQFEFKGNYISGGAPFDILTYCIDLAHSVSLGNVNYNSYTIIPIASYASMTTAKINSLNALLTHTTPLLNAATGQNAINVSAAAQMAVWEIMFETQPAWSVTNTSSALYVSGSGSPLTTSEGLANTYLGNVANNTWAVNSAYDLKVLYSPSQQTQVFLTPSVPEPATWAMMMLGFGAIGGALRRRQNVATRIRFA